MREVRFHIHRKSTFAGALLPYRMYINGQYIGTIRNGKSLDANVPKAGVYYIEDDILSSRNAVIYDNGLSEYSVVIKRAGGWRTESYNEFYMEKGNVLEQLPSFHWEKLFELQQSMSQSERLLALSVEFWMSAMDDLQEVLTSEHLFEIIDPYSIDKQGVDVGKKYRTGIYSTASNHLDEAKAFINSREDRDKIAVEVLPLTNYVRSADEHQHHLERFPEDGYLCHIPDSVLNKFRIL